MASLVILAASVFEISCGKTDKQIDKHINAGENGSHVTTVGVVNNKLHCYS